MFGFWLVARYNYSVTSIIIKFPIRCYDTGEVFYRYCDYLYSRHWKRVRIKQIDRHPFCFCCHEKAHDIHHKCYDRLGSETPKDVLSLCRACHQTVHDLNESLDSAHDTLEAVLIRAQVQKKEKEITPIIKATRKVRIAGMAFNCEELQAAFYAPADSVSSKMDIETALDLYEKDRKARALLL